MCAAKRSARRTPRVKKQPGAARTGETAEGKTRMAKGKGAHQDRAHDTPGRGAVPVQTGKPFRPTAAPRAGGGQRGSRAPRARVQPGAKADVNRWGTPRSRQHESQRRKAGSSPRVHRQMVDTRNVVHPEGGLSLSLKRKGIPTLRQHGRASRTLCGVK